MLKKTEIIAKLRTLSTEMIDLGTDIDYYYGLNQLADYGAAIVNAGHLAENCANEMELETP